MDFYKLIGFRSKKKFETFMNEKDGLYQPIQEELRNHYKRFGYKVLTMFERYNFDVFEYSDMTNSITAKMTTSQSLCNDCCLNRRIILDQCKRIEELKKENQVLEERLAFFRKQLNMF